MTKEEEIDELFKLMLTPDIERRLNEINLSVTITDNGWEYRTSIGGYTSKDLHYPWEILSRIQQNQRK